MEQTLEPAPPLRCCLTLMVAATLFHAVFPAASVCQATTVSDALDEIGYTRLVTMLGGDTPNGVGVPISLVEAPNGSGAYFPDTYPVPTNPIYTAATDPFSEDVDFTDGSGMASKGVSSHAASTVGSFFFGNTSSAAGANAVTVYEANRWLTRHPAFSQQSRSRAARFSGPKFQLDLVQQHFIG